MKALTTLLILLGLTIHPVSASADCLDNFCLRSSRGEEVCRKDFKGKNVLVDFWTSWCPNCLASLEWMGNLHNSFSDDQLKVIAINLDENRADAEPLFSQISPKIEILLDTKGDTAEKCDFASIPAAILIGKDGSIVERFSGESEANHSKIIDTLKKLTVASEEK